MASTPAFDPTRTFLNLMPDGEAARLDTGEPGFWRRLRCESLDGSLMGVVRMGRNSALEMRPDRDEILILGVGLD